MEEAHCLRQEGIRQIGAWRRKIEEFGEERAADLFLDHDLTVSSLSWAGGFVHTDRRSRAEALDDAVEAIRMARLLRAGQLLVTTGHRHGHTVNHARKMVVEALRELADLAGELGIGLAIQPVTESYSNESAFASTFKRALDLLHRCQHPQIGLCLDTYQWRSEWPTALERIAEIVEHVRVVALGDSKTPYTDGDRCLPGTGDIPIRRIVSELEATGYRGAYEFHWPSTQAWSNLHADLMNQVRKAFESLSPVPVSVVS